MKDSVRLRVVRNGVELEVEGARDFVLEMLNRFGHVGDDTPLVPPAEPGAIDSAKTLSAREFVQLLNVKRHVDKVAAFGYFLEHHSGQPEFSAGDINNCYYEAKMESSNTSQAIIQNIKRGFIMEAKGSGKGKKKYMLTQSGEEFIRERVPA